MLVVGLVMGPDRGRPLRIVVVRNRADGMLMLMFVLVSGGRGPDQRTQRLPHEHVEEDHQAGGRRYASKEGGAPEHLRANYNNTTPPVRLTRAAYPSAVGRSRSPDALILPCRSIFAR